MVYFQKAGIWSWCRRMPLNNSHMMMKNGIRVAAIMESELSIFLVSSIQSKWEGAYLKAAIHCPQDVAKRKNMKNIRKLYPAVKPNGSPTMK